MFNSVKWSDMFDDLKYMFWIPKYLLWMIRDYLNDGTKQDAGLKRSQQGKLRNQHLNLWNASL